MNRLRFQMPARHHLHFPRTSREAFGFDLDALPGRVSFIGRQRAGRLPLAATVLLLAAVFIFLGATK